MYQNRKTDFVPDPQDGHPYTGAPEAANNDQPADETRKSRKARRKHQIDAAVKIDILTHIMRDDELMPGGLKIALALAVRHNDDTGECFPDIDRLMADTKMKRRTVLDALYGPTGQEHRGLITRGWFTVIKERRSHDPSKNAPNRYSLNLAKVGLSGCVEDNPINPLLVRKSADLDRKKGRHGAEIRSPMVRRSANPQCGNPHPNCLEIGELVEGNSRNEKTHFDAAARQHQGEKFLSDEELAEGDAMRARMQNRPEDLTEGATQAQARTMKEKVPVPRDIRPSPETMDRLTGQGITQAQIEKSVGEFLRRSTGLDTLENWQHRLDVKWMVRERVPTAQHGNFAGAPFPEKFEPDERVQAVVRTLKMPDAEISLVVQKFYLDVQAATGFKALSNDWHAQLASVLISADLRYRQQNKRSGVAI